MTRAWTKILLLSIAVLAFAGRAAAAPRLHALIIGHNGVFPDADSDSESPPLSPLRYADDDAAAMAAFIGQVAASVHLLTLMDATTQALYPELASRAKPPTLAAVEEAVMALNREIARDRGRGVQSAVWLFFSGHGGVSRLRGPGLALSDGSLTREFLYERVLARLPATYVHVLVDACHAESVVRPRGSHADVVSVPPAAANAALLQVTLARFPNVGAMLASSHGAEAHEWDAIGHGVFTHELLSGLRGAADVNGDRLLEYSEVYAFMSAANRGVADARARLAIVARPPALDRRAPLLSLSDFASSKVSWLTGISGDRGLIQVTDELGRRLATLHNARDHTASLLLPSGSTVLVTAGGVEAQLLARAGGVTRFNDLPFEPSGSRSRSVVSHALARGLFTSAYGRGYYEGFTDNAPDLVAVPFERDAGPAQRSRSTGSRPPPDLRATVGFGGSRSTAAVLGTSYGAQIALGGATTHGLLLAVDAFTARDGPLREWRTTAKIGWSWQTAPRSVQGYGGPRLGVGWIVQQVDGQPDRSSAVGLAGGSLGLVTRVTDRVGVFAEVELAALLMKRDGGTRLSPAPSAWLGNTFEW